MAVGYHLTRCNDWVNDLIQFCANEFQARGCQYNLICTVVPKGYGEFPSHYSWMKHLIEYGLNQSLTVSLKGSLACKDSFKTVGEIYYLVQRLLGKPVQQQNSRSSQLHSILSIGRRAFDNYAPIYWCIIASIWLCRNWRWLWIKFPSRFIKVF